MTAFTEELRGYKPDERMSDDAIRKVWLMHKAADQIDRLREALGYFLDDPRFQVGVGGNPNVVERMIDRARAAYAEGVGP